MIYRHKYSEQLLNIDNGKIELHLHTQFIKLKDSLCTIINYKNELFENVFAAVLNNYLNHNWLSGCAILAGKNAGVDEIKSTLSMTTKQ